MRTLPWAFLALLTALHTAAAQPQVVPGDFVDISTGASGTPLTGAVAAVAVGADGTFYVAGEFAVGRQTSRVYSVARWTGVAWAEVGQVSGGPFTRINALAVGADGSLYVGGRFDAVDGVAALNVARWTGAEWQPLGAGLGLLGRNPEVVALAAGPDGSVYAGGSFVLSSDGRLEGVARFDGAVWTRVGAGLSDTVRALAFTTDGALYAGGRAITATGTGESASVVRFDGTFWKALYGPDAPTGTVQAFQIDRGGALYAGGEKPFDADSSRISLWNGRRWTRFGAGLDTPVNALALDGAGRLVAGTGGEYGSSTDACCLSVWDGRAWVPFGGGVTNTVRALSSGPPDFRNAGKLYVGGLFTSAGGVPARSAAVWEGTAWRAYGSSLDGTIMDVAYGPDGALYAAGSFSTAGSIKASGIARWTGTAWEPLGGGFGRYSTVSSVLFGPDGSLYAGGRFTSVGGIPAQAVARWDGAAWHALGRGPSPSADQDVQDMAFGPDGKLYVLGLFYPGNRSLFRWDGAAWEAVGGGGVVSNGGNDAYLNAIAFGTDGSLYVGGTFTTIGGVAARHVARWDGAAWRPLGGGLTRDDSAGPPTGVRDLALAPDGTLVVGGSFLFAGGNPAQNVARWDGAVWVSYNGGLVQEVFAIQMLADGRFYAGGRFRVEGVGTRGLVGLWDGARFRTLPDAISGSVFALTAGADGALVIGGEFLTAGATVSPGIARFEPSEVVADEAPPAGDALSLSLAPNPARGAAVATVTAAGPVTIAMFDALGRRVAAATSEAPGTRALPLDLSRLAPGVYVVRLTAGAATRTQRLVVAR